MSDKSSIEWTDATWNPVTGCTKVSAGCDHCYAETFAERFRGVPRHPYEQGFDLKLWPQRLGIPLGWRRPRRVFVNSMSDLFHRDVPDEYILRVFRVMAEAEIHTFQVLTKRPDRMMRLLQRWEDRGVLAPLPNVWLGTSIEAMGQAWRAEKLRRTPAAVRFISAEPLLGPLGSLDLTGIDWVIAGGESGPGARPANPEWFRELRSGCRRAGVAFFMKQLGSVWAREMGLRGKGHDWEDLPEDLRVRDYPSPLNGAAQSCLGAPELAEQVGIPL